MKLFINWMHDTAIFSSNFSLKPWVRLRWAIARWSAPPILHAMLEFYNGFGFRNRVGRWLLIFLMPVAVSAAAWQMLSALVLYRAEDCMSDLNLKLDFGEHRIRLLPKWLAFVVASAKFWSVHRSGSHCLLTHLKDILSLAFISLVEFILICSVLSC